MAARKIVAKKRRARRKAVKRELIDTGTNTFYGRRNRRGPSFKEVEDVGRSLAQDRRREAKKVAKRGPGDRGDRRMTTTIGLELEKLGIRAQRTRGGSQQPRIVRVLQRR